MHCSVAKFVVDAEQCAMAYRMVQGPQWADFDQALGAVADTGPGGHFLKAFDEIPDTSRIT